MSKTFVTRQGVTVECSELAIIHLNRLTAMYVDFQGVEGMELTLENLKKFLFFLETQLRQATMTMTHLDGLKTPEERETLVSIYVEAVEMAFQRDEPFIFGTGE